MTEETRTGRPPVVLEDGDRVRLIEVAERLGAAEARVRELESERQALAVEIHAAGGGSYRAIGEALGLSKEQARALIGSTE
jgi:hypothetical protein